MQDKYNSPLIASILKRGGSLNERRSFRESSSIPALPDLLDRENAGSLDLLCDLLHFGPDTKHVFSNEFAGLFLSGSGFKDLLDEIWVLRNVLGSNSSAVYCF